MIRESTRGWSSSARGRCARGSNVRPRDLPVDFTGFIGCRDTVASILASADVALAPGPHETFGLAALEALACGTPAVVSRTSALAEILTADSGAAADNDPGAIAAAVSSIISRPEAVAHATMHGARRAVPLAAVGGGHARRARRGYSVAFARSATFHR